MLIVHVFSGLGGLLTIQCRSEDREPTAEIVKTASGNYNVGM
jgi:hypothetical protein